MSQRKPKPGKGYLHQKNALKRQNLSQAVKYIEYLEGEVEAMQYDPGTVVGKFFNQYRELYGQNSRLSVLAACLLKKLGEKVQLTKEEMESFKGNRIKISWTLPDGVEKVEDASTYTFTYELQPETAGPVTVVPTEVPGTAAQEADNVTVAVLGDHHCFEERITPEVASTEDVLEDDLENLAVTEAATEASE